MKTVILITGLSGSGKTTLAKGIQGLLGSDRVGIIDGDSVRSKGSKHLRFSRADRLEHLMRMADFAEQSDDEISIVASIAPYKDARAFFLKKVARRKKVILIYNSTALEVCESRDPKGLYKRARAGEIDAFTGISDPYEIPENADLVLDTFNHSIGASVQKVLGCVINVAAS